MQLTKYPSESRTYTWNYFNSGAGSTDPRGTIWAQSSFSSMEAFQPALTLPLIFSLLTTAGTATITVVRSDGQTSDLGVSKIQVAGNAVTATVSGGTSGLTYTLTAVATTNEGNTIACQGMLLVSTAIAV